MDRLRAAFPRLGWGPCCRSRRPHPPAARRGVKPGWRRTLVLDVLCVVGILALAAIVALIGRGVEKL